MVWQKLDEEDVGQFRPINGDGAEVLPDDAELLQGGNGELRLALRDAELLGEVGVAPLQEVRLELLPECHDPTGALVAHLGRAIPVHDVREDDDGGEVRLAARVRYRPVPVLRDDVPRDGELPDRIDNLAS